MDKEEKKKKTRGQKLFNRMLGQEHEEIESLWVDYLTGDEACTSYYSENEAARFINTSEDLNG